MAGILWSILPFTNKEKGSADAPPDHEDDSNNFEYSFAVVYSGPLVTYDVPRAVPVDVSRIPVATVASSVSSLNDLSLPVVQPIVKSSRSKKNRSNESKGSGAIGSEVFLESKDVLRESSDGANNPTALGCANGDMGGLELSSGMESSGQFGCGNGDDCRYVLHHGICNDSCNPCGGSFKVLKIHDDVDEDEVGDLRDYLIPANRDSIASGLSSRSVSSEIFSSKEEDCIEEVPGHVRRPSVVTFRDPESNEVIQDRSHQSEVGNLVLARPTAVRPGKKGTCYRCMRGNKFTGKEVCIVCGAKYCCNCVVRAMGSMPEGRKCVTCIGHKIDEGKRETLGKCSRMLKHLLPAAEVDRIMESERTCEPNQLPSELIYVNRQHLSPQELYLLLTCQYPPKKLKPGYYWYDKVSGFWGKEGHKPCQIISPELTVGGHMPKDASNGHTNILINNREITTAELLMLQVAGVKCEGTTSFWVSADGSYQEEGMKNIKGKIWETNKARLICSMLSLPIPPDLASSSKNEAKNSISNGVQQELLQKLLLVGHKKSGTSTIFKQAKLVYNVPFFEGERQDIKSMIQSNLYNYLGMLLEGRERFEEELLKERRTGINDCCSSSDNGIYVEDKTIYSISPKLKAFSDWLLQVMLSGNLESIFPAATRVYAPYVEDLWKDPAIQATYSRKNELELLPRVATYFLERAVEIARTDYEPSDIDILYAEGITPVKGISYMEYLYPSLPDDSSEAIGYQHDSSLRYQLIRVLPRNLGENCKWLEMFEDVDIVLFCVSLTDYAEFSTDSSGVSVNNMMLSKQLFERIVTHPTFEEKKFLLILNKFDLLEEVIEGVPLTRCEWFHDFNPVIGHNPVTTRCRATNPSLAHRAFQYIAMKFKRLYNSLTDRKLYVSQVTGLEPDNVDDALRYAREILKWNEEEPHYQNQEHFSGSIEASSSS